MSLGGFKACFIATFSGSGWTLSTPTRKPKQHTLVFEELTFAMLDF